VTLALPVARTIRPNVLQICKIFRMLSNINGIRSVPEDAKIDFAVEKVSNSS